MGRPAPLEAAEPSEPSGAELAVAAAALVASLGLRIFYSLRQSFDTDEPQHLHVVWAWSQGLVPYRDVFDNHVPLFHLLFVPLVAGFDERAEILLWARIAMLPLVGALLYGLYHLSRAVFCARAGLWSAALASLVPSFLLTSCEFRADVLWAALWIVGLAVWASGRGLWRGFSAGLLAGAALAASIKTLFLVSSFAAAGFLATRGAARAERPDGRAVGAAIAGLAVVPVAMLALLASRGALRAFFDCVLAHNFGSVILWDHPWLRTFFFAITLPLLVAAAGSVSRRSASNGTRRATLVLATGLYLTMINSFCPLLPRQHFLPFYPMLVLLLVAAGLALRPSSRAPMLAAIAAVEIGLTLWVEPPSRSGAHVELGTVADVLRLTTSANTVMDLKGESVFRRRPVYYVLESITEEMIRRGDIRDDIAERLVASGTFVSVVDSPRFPPTARQFLLDNYISVGHVRVAGQHLRMTDQGHVSFEIALPGRYAILSPLGPVSGALDEAPFSGSGVLRAGLHSFQATAATSPLALLWAAAADRGFSPFHPNPSR